MPTSSATAILTQGLVTMEHYVDPTSYMFGTFFALLFGVILGAGIVAICWAASAYLQKQVFYQQHPSLRERFERDSLKRIKSVVDKEFERPDQIISQPEK